MQKLGDIIQKHTNIQLEAEHLFNHTKLAIDNSVFIVEDTRSLPLDEFTYLIEIMMNTTKIKGFLCTEISKKYLPHNITIPIIVTTSRIINNIIDEYYCKRPQKIIGVTGSYGKTSTTRILYHLLTMIGVKTIVNNSSEFMGINNDLLRIFINATPSNLDLKRILHEAGKNNIEVAVLEVTHAGIDQNRIKDIVFDAGIFTGFTKDHMEYFKSMKQYFVCKEKFISQVPIRVINEEIFEYGFAKSLNKLPHIVYGVKTNDIKQNSFVYKNTKYDKGFNLPYYIKNNLVGCMILLKELGYKNIFDYMDMSLNLSGVMEKAGVNKNGAEIYIDNAYRLNIVEKILDIFQKYKKIILIIGVGGDRYRGATYRADIGKLFSKTDMMIVTDDNPRTENASKIRKEIIGKNNLILNIGPRILAIQTAINFATKHHVVLILGKGCENHSIYNNYKSYASDKECVDFALLNI